ncbi:MAG: efflux RND transporter periplasmic adaptor subunit [Bacteroidota bacterium]
MKYTSLILSILIFTAACSEAPKKKMVKREAKIIPVRIADVKPQDKSLPIQASGIVASQEELKLAFKIGGIISAVYVNEGDRVKRGQVLARLDPSEIQAQVSSAKTALEKAERDLDRGERLFADTVTTLEQVQDLTTARDVAANQLQIAEFNQKYSTIYAPSSGRVLKRFAEKGEVIGPGNPVYFIAANSSAQVLRVGLTDVDVVQIKIGDQAKLSFDAYPNESFKGVVSEIAAGSDPMSGTYEVEVSIKSDKTHVKNGFIGKAQIFPQAKKGIMRIPIEAVVEADPSSASIYVPDSSGEGVLPITLSRYEIGNDFILTPETELGSHKAVITDGARYLRKESRIQIISESPKITGN